MTMTLKLFVGLTAWGLLTSASLATAEAPTAEGVPKKQGARFITPPPITCPAVLVRLNDEIVTAIVQERNAVAQALVDTRNDMCRNHGVPVGECGCDARVSRPPSPQ